MTRRGVFVLLLGLGFGMTTPRLSEADRYVRQGATGSGSGADWTNACTNFTGSCAVSALSRPDTVWVADGSYGSRTFDRAASGTAVITIKKATPATHGTSTGWSDAFGAATASFGDGVTFLTNYWTFDGSTRTSLTTGHGFVLNNSGATSAEIVTLGTPGGAGVTNITLSYVNIIGSGYNNLAGAVDRAIYDNASGMANITIDHSYIHDSYVHLLTRNVNGMLIEHNYFANNKSSPANHGEPWSDTGTNNVIFRYNYVKNPEGSAVIFVGNGSNTLSANWQIYGNVFFYLNYVVGSGHNPGVSFLVHVPYDGSNNNLCADWKFFNNTIYGFTQGSNPAGFQIENPAGGTVPLVKNNIYDTNNTVNFLNTTHTHNYYRSSNHSAETGEQVGSTSLFVNLASENFHLTAATSAGDTVGNPVGNTTDLDGVTRGGDGTWDRGAFEFGTGGPAPPAAPSNLRITLALLGLCAAALIPIATRR